MASKRDRLQHEAFRLWILEKQSLRDVAESLSISKNTAQSYIDAELEAVQGDAAEERRHWLAESVAEKQAIWRLALGAFETVAEGSPSASGYLNTMLNASIATDKLRGLLIDRSDVTSAGQPIGVNLAGLSDDDLRALAADARERSAERTSQTPPA